MFVYKVVLIVFLAVPLNGNNISTYSIPEPRIEAYTPEGFSVSIEDAPGINLFAFHGSINKELKDLAAGDYSKDILHTENGRWVFDDRTTRLSVGDVIYYWLFVIRNGLGYRLDNGWFEVKELVDSPYETPRPTGRPPRPRPPSSQGNKNQPDPSCNTVEPTITSTTESPERLAFLRICELTIFNTTQALLSLQSQVDSLRKTNQQMSALIERYPDGRKLTISGRIPPDEDPVATVRFIMRGKLNLNPDIVSAKKNSDGSIVFELSTLGDKLEILEVAKEKLKDSRIVIS